MSDVILEARGLRKTYLSGDRRLEVLSDVALSVARGESVSIRGESGSGKSTLLHLLAGLDQPDAGEVLWAGSTDTGTGRRAKFLGMVFQSFYLIPELNALENVVMAMRMTGPIGAAERAPPRRCSPVSDWPSARTTCPRIFPAASASVSPWPAR